MAMELFILSYIKLGNEGKLVSWATHIARSIQVLQATLTVGGSDHMHWMKNKPHL